MTQLNRQQQEFFWHNGYLVVDNAVSPELLSELQNVFRGWVEEADALLRQQISITPAAGKQSSTEAPE